MPRRFISAAYSIQPAVMDGEHVVRDPQLLRLVAVEDPLHFVHHGRRGPAPVRLAEGRMAAPAAMIRAAARRDHRDRSRAVMLAPDAQVSVDIDALAVRPRLRIEIGSSRAGPVLTVRRRRAKDQPGSAPAASAQDRLQRQFAFALHHHIRAGGQILLRIIGRLRSAHHHLPAARHGALAESPARWRASSGWRRCRASPAAPFPESGTAPRASRRWNRRSRRRNPARADTTKGRAARAAHRAS